MTIIFGVRKSPRIYPAPVQLMPCRHCAQTDLFGLQRKYYYFHLFFVPILPLVKASVLRCTHCQEDLKPDDYPGDDQRWIEEEAARHKTHRPWWHYLVLVYLGYTFVQVQLRHW